MARVFAKNGETMIVPHKKMTYQGDGPRTKASARSNSSRRKKSRGQGR